MNGIPKIARGLAGMCLLVGLTLAACDTVPPPTISPGTGPDEIRVEPMQIHSVQVVGLLDQDPPQPAATIEGLIGDSCNELDSVAQARNGNVISVQIYVRRTTGPNITCAELAQSYSATLPLEGDFPPGDYMLVINGTPATFTIHDTATEATTDCVPNSEFVENVTVPDGEQIVPGEPFIKTWRIRNSGTCPWDGTWTLTQIEGTTIVPSSGLGSAPLPDTAPGEETEISIELIMSLEVAVGSLQAARFQMHDPAGNPFGAQPFVRVTVGPGGQQSDQNDCTFDSEFIDDVTIPDGTEIAAGQTFTKTWRMLNNGTCPWDETIKLIQLEGDYILPAEGPASLPVPAAEPEEEIQISIDLTLSSEAPIGSEQEARFQLRAPDGELFGMQPFVLIKVAERQ